MAFYKYDEVNFLEAENKVQAPTFTMIKEDSEIYNYPVDGWYWFDTRDEALSFYNIEDPDLVEINDLSV